MATDSNGGGGAGMIVLIVALVAIVGIFAYFMANNKQQTSVIQAPTPQVAIPTPAKPGAQ